MTIAHADPIKVTDTTATVSFDMIGRAVRAHAQQETSMVAWETDDGTAIVSVSDVLGSRIGDTLAAQLHSR